jgi:hypothetical protein
MRRRETVADLGGEIEIVGAGGVEKRPALGRAERQRRVEERVGSPSAFSIHL